MKLRYLFCNKSLRNPDNRSIAKSGLFNVEWYNRQYPEVKNSGLDAITHYIKIGWRKGYNPSVKFDGNAYLIQNSDVADADINPLLHYILCGKKEGRKKIVSGREKNIFDTIREWWQNKLLRDYKLENATLLYKNVKCVYQPAFSIIMPLNNYNEQTDEAISSLLAQTYQNFELLIVDNANNNSTAIIAKKYPRQLKSGKIKYFLHSYIDIYKTFNFGLSKANHEWTAYLNSGIRYSPDFLAEYAKYIMIYKYRRLFYAKSLQEKCNTERGYYFDLKLFKQTNYIDLYAVVHHISLFEKFGGFEEKMTHLQDWELITRYSQFYDPLFINKTLVYNNSSENVSMNNNTQINTDMIFYRTRYGE